MKPLFDYSFYDIPNTMYRTVKSVIKLGKPAVVRLINADSIKDKVSELTANTNVKVIFENV